MKRRVLVLVHCQEANRNRLVDDFIYGLAEEVRERDFDEVVHLSAPSIWGHEDSPVFEEVRELVDRIVEWDFQEFEPRQEDGYITAAEVDIIFGEMTSYQEAGTERMELSYWNIPLEDRRRALLRYGDEDRNSIFLQDERYSRQFAWIPEALRNPQDWHDATVTLGGVFGDQCVQDVRQILEWMGINHKLDCRLVGYSID